MKKIISLVLVCSLMCAVTFSKSKDNRKFFRYKDFQKLNFAEGKELVSESLKGVDTFTSYIEQTYKNPDTGDCYIVQYEVGLIQGAKYSAKGWDAVKPDWIYGVYVENIGKLF